MNTELENIQQQVSALQENTDLITQDIVRIMPTIVSLLSENEKNFGKSLIFVALGEGVAIYGLLISILIINKI